MVNLVATVPTQEPEEPEFNNIIIFLPISFIFRYTITKRVSDLDKY